jgi:hypothetical protein
MAVSTPHDYMTKSVRFFEAAGLCVERDYRTPAITNAGLAAVAAGNAVCCAFGRSTVCAETRDRAPDLLRACTGTSWEQEAAVRAPHLAGILRTCPDCYRGEPEPCTKTVASVLEQVRDLIEWAARVVESEAPAVGEHQE